MNCTLVGTETSTGRRRAVAYRTVRMLLGTSLARRSWRRKALRERGIGVGRQAGTSEGDDDSRGAAC
jgi:hypothetical protein